MLLDDNAKQSGKDTDEAFKASEIIRRSQELGEEWIKRSFPSSRPENTPSDSDSKE